MSDLGLSVLNKTTLNNQENLFSSHDIPDVKDEEVNAVATSLQNIALTPASFWSSATEDVPRYPPPPATHTFAPPPVNGTGMFQPFVPMGRRMVTPRPFKQGYPSWSNGVSGRKQNMPFRKVPVSQPQRFKREDNLLPLQVNMRSHV